MSRPIVRVRQMLRWATAGFIAAALATWLFAIAFAIAGFRRNAEEVTRALTLVGAIALALLALLVAVSLLVVWLDRPSKSS